MPDFWHPQLPQVANQEALTVEDSSYQYRGCGSSFNRCGQVLAGFTMVSKIILTFNWAQ
jgi:hypothetical protein